MADVDTSGALGGAVNGPFGCSEPVIQQEHY